MLSNRSFYQGENPTIILSGGKPYDLINKYKELQAYNLREGTTIGLQHSKIAAAHTFSKSKLPF